MFDVSTIKVPPGINNPAAYRAAVARKIAQRQYEARRKRAGEKLAAWLSDPANMALHVAISVECAKQRPNPFIDKMALSLQEWGSLTDGQAAAARKVLADMETRDITRRAEAAERARVSRHVGIVGKRSDFRLKLLRRWEMDGYYGRSYGHVFADETGNEFVYIGSVELDMAVEDTRTIRATIKGHGERDGVAQTRLNRAVLQEEDDRPSEAEFLAGRFSASGKKGVVL